MRKRMVRGYPGFPVDPRTGEPDTESPEGKAALRASRIRDEVTSSALRCLLRLEVRDRLRVKRVAILLQSAHDELVTMALDWLARQEAWEALPEVLQLFAMYPKPNRWETGG